MRIFIAGYGFLGREIARIGRSQGAILQTCSRSPLEDPSHLSLDLGSSEIEKINECDLGVFCASSDSGKGYRETYIGLQENIIRRLTSRIRHYIFISSTRVYGDLSREVNEETEVSANGDEKSAALLEAESCARLHPCSTVVRSSGIYNEDRNPFLSFALSNRMEGLDQYTNRIHVNDLARVVLHAFAKEKHGDYVASDQNPITRRQFRQWLKGKNMAEPRNTAFGKRCIPRRLLDERFKFGYPDCRIP
jgi:nucleoside-diphosphate-sugar epimerase